VEMFTIQLTHNYYDTKVTIFTHHSLHFAPAAFRKLLYGRVLVFAAIYSN
jgi:hypothetical protein